MTTHRIDEPILFVSWINSPNIAGPLHIGRPRSQKGIAYCDEPIPLRLHGIGEESRFREFTIDHPDVIPLEVRIERDFAGLCCKCARQFLEEVTKENPDMRLCPVTWRLIIDRCDLTPAQIEIVQKGIDFDKLEREHQVDLRIEDRKEAGL